MTSFTAGKQTGVFGVREAVGLRNREQCATPDPENQYKEKRALFHR
jgi:hypothetical protein